VRRLRRLDPKSAELPPDGWIVGFSGDPRTVPPFCSWCGTSWTVTHRDGHLLCKKCDLFDPDPKELVS
jgi:hypothetical protein